MGRRGEGAKAGAADERRRVGACACRTCPPPKHTLGSTKNRNPVLYIWFSVDPPILMFFLISRSGPEIIQILLQFVFLQHPCPIQHPRDVILLSCSSRAAAFASALDDCHTQAHALHRALLKHSQAVLPLFFIAAYLNAAGFFA